MNNRLIVPVSVALFLALTVFYSRTAIPAVNGNGSKGSIDIAASKTNSGSLGGSASQAGTTSTNTGMNNNSSAGTGAAPAGINSPGSFTSESETGVGASTSGPVGSTTTGSTGANTSESLLNPAGSSSNPNTTETNLNPAGVGPASNSNLNGALLIHRVGSSASIPSNSSMLSAGEIIKVDRGQSVIAVRDENGRVKQFSVADRAIFRSLNQGDRVQIFAGKQ